MCLCMVVKERMRAVRMGVSASVNMAAGMGNAVEAIRPIPTSTFMQSTWGIAVIYCVAVIYSIQF